MLLELVVYSRSSIKASAWMLVVMYAMQLPLNPGDQRLLNYLILRYHTEALDKLMAWLFIVEFGS